MVYRIKDVSFDCKLIQFHYLWSRYDKSTFQSQQEDQPTSLIQPNFNFLSMINLAKDSKFKWIKSVQQNGNDWEEAMKKQIEVQKALIKFQSISNFNKVGCEYQKVKSLLDDPARINDALEKLDFTTSEIQNEIIKKLEYIRC